MRIVLKVGGSVLEPHSDSKWAHDLAHLVRRGHQVLVVHGAGPLINERLVQRKVPVVFIDGQRVTTPEVMHEVVPVMRGTANLSMVAQCQKVGILAIGLSGADGGWFDATRDTAGLGLVGRVATVRADLIERIWAARLVPMVAPIAPEQGTGTLLNLNGDWAASGIAQQLGVDMLIFYTDTGGVRMHREDPESVITHMNAEECERLIEHGIINQGMVPKVKAAMAALKGGVPNVWIGRPDDGKRSTCVRLTENSGETEGWAFG